MKRTLLLFATLLLLGIQSYAQTGVAINTTGADPDISAMLDVSSTEKGLLIPRMTEAQRTAIALPAKGLLVYQNDETEGFYYFDGSAWTNLSLVNFCESNYEFDSKTGVKLQATNSEADVDVVISPKGNGAIMAQQPDGAATGGDSRGTHAVDLQTSRGEAGQVASGSFSVIAGGYWNEANKNHATVGGGSNNIASGSYSLIPGGKSNIASGFSSCAFGTNNESIGMNSVAFGYDNIAEADQSIVAGYVNIGNVFSETIFGRYAQVATGSTSSWEPSERLFSVGNGTGPSGDLRSNALTILKNANTTIGGSLTINGNGTSTSYLFPETRGTNGQVLKTSGDGSTSWANAVEPGTTPGQIQYWNGTAWVTVEAGTYGQVLEFRNDGPEWVDKNINTLNIGDTYKGGIIAYFLQSGDPGYDANIRHGFIASPADISTGASWGCMGSNVGDANIVLGAGVTNTLSIVTDCSEPGIAARICYDLILNGYSDWFLPSGNELLKLYQNKSAIGGFENTYYWSSTKINWEYAIAIDFTDGSIPYGIEKSSLMRVRAVRAF